MTILLESFNGALKELTSVSLARQRRPIKRFIRDKLESLLGRGQCADLARHSATQLPPTRTAW